MRGKSPPQTQVDRIGAVADFELRITAFGFNSCSFGLKPFCFCFLLSILAFIAAGRPANDKHGRTAETALVSR